MSPPPFALISPWLPVAVAPGGLEHTVEGAVAALLLGAGWILFRRLERRTRELRLSEERWRTLFEHAGVVMFEEDFTGVVARLDALRAAGVTDLRAHLAAHPAVATGLFQLLRVSAANRAALALLGGGDLAGMNAGIRTFAPAAPSEAFLEKIAAIWERRLVVTLETGLTDLDGVEHHGLMQCAMPTATGRPDFSRVLVAFTDLTAQRASEERYRALFDGAVEGVFETRPEGGFRRANLAMARMLGYAAPEELLALTPEEFGSIYVQPGRRAEFLAQLGARSDIADFESEVRRRDGSTIWISENVHVVRDGAGRVQYLQGFVTDITAHKQAEKALRASEQRYRTLFEQAPVAIVEFDYQRLQAWFDRQRAAGVTDLEAHFAAHPEEREQVLALTPLSGMNEAAVRIYGARSKEELQQRLAEVLTPEAVAVRLNNVLVLWRGGNQTEGEMPLRVLGGGERQFFYRWWMPLVDGRPGMQRSQTVLVDITGIRAAERALRASETRYRVLFEHSPIAILEFDYRPVRDWQNGLCAAGVEDLAAYLAANPKELESALRLAPLVGANDAAVRLYAAGSAAELCAGFGRVFSAEVSAARRRIYLELWAGAHEVENDLPVRAFDGTVREVHTFWWVPIVEGSPFYERAQLALLDLTEVKAAERALAAERERLRVTLSAMSESVITVDPSGVVRFINDAACKLTGWPAAEAAGRSIDEVCMLRHEKTGVPVRTPVASVLVQDRVLDLPPQTALRQRHGGPLLVEGRCAPMHDTADRGIGAVLVLRDVTERTRLELELQRASKLESVGLLAGGIAHDFNNIMAVVMGNLTLAQLDPGRSENTARWLKAAEQGTLRARDLTQQLLTFAKGGEPVRSAVRLPEVVRDAAEFALHGSTARCEFAVDDALWPADADKGQIGQVVQNLIINAAQAMPEGGVIRVALDNAEIAAGTPGPLAAGRYVTLTLADSGTGIAPEHLARIFEPYFTTKEQGTGLGLATVYSIVKKHRGQVVVESEVGRGTTFRLWLPAASTEPEVKPARRPRLEPMRGRILLMDDEEEIRQMATEVLKRLGMEATTVADGAAVAREYGAARAAGRPYDVVMLDLTVPGGMGGLQAMRELLKLDPQVRAIVASGYSNDPVLANPREHGFRGVVPKPYRVSDLAEVLRTVLAQP